MPINREEEKKEGKKGEVPKTEEKEEIGILIIRN